jgi:GNAT superfamily N-acetyltransferase
MTAVAPLLDYAIRPAQPEDHRFIIETTAKVRQPRDLSWTEWKTTGEMRARADLEYGGCFVAEADGVIVGFVLFARIWAALEMLYVKREFRGLGLGMALLNPGDVKVLITTATPSWRQWTRLHRIRWEEVRA